MTGLEALFWALVCTLIMLVIFAEPNQVPQDERWATVIFGKYFRTLDPGLQFTIRWIEEIAWTHVTENGQLIKKVRGKRSAREHARHINVQGILTKNNIRVDVEVMLRNRLMTLDEDDNIRVATNDPDTRGPVYKNTFVIPDSIEESLKVLTDSVVRNVVEKEDSDKVLDEASFPNLQAQFRDLMVPTLNRWGEWFLQLDIIRIIPPQNVLEASEKVVTSRKDGQAAQAKAEGDAEAIKTNADAKAAAIIKIGNAEKQAAVAHGEGTKTRLELETTSKAAGMLRVGRACKKLGSMNPMNDAFNAIFAEEHLDAFSNMAKNGGLVVLSSGDSVAGGLASAVAMVRKGLLVGDTTKVGSDPTPSPTEPTS